jgi:hypothetical protein
MDYMAFINNQILLAIVIVVFSLGFVVLLFVFDYMNKLNKMQKGVRVIDLDSSVMKYVIPKYDKGVYVVKYYVGFFNSKKFLLDEISGKDYVVRNNEIYLANFNPKQQLELKTPDIAKIISKSIAMDLLGVSPFTSFSIIMLIMGILIGFIIGNVIPLSHFVPTPIHNATTTTTNPPITVSK